MRPRTLDEFVGQEHLLGEGSALRTAIEHGPPALDGPLRAARDRARRRSRGSSPRAAGAAFEELSAVEAGRAEVRGVLERAAHRRRPPASRTIFFLDEIHRFNKAQQDALLPAVEEGLVTLIGATTENPYFEVNSALLSRTQVYELHALTGERRRGAAAPGARPRRVRRPRRSTTRRSRFLAARSGRRRPHRAGRARARAARPRRRASRSRSSCAEDALQRRALRYDKRAATSTTTRSRPGSRRRAARTPTPRSTTSRSCSRAARTRASSPGGWSSSPPRTSATPTRRRCRWPSPRRTRSSTSGCPRPQLALAQAAIYLALAPKSNAAYRAIGAARAHVREHGAKPPPACAATAAGYPGARALGRGQGYDYPHDHPGTSASRSSCPTRSWASASTSPTTPRRSCASAWRRSGGRAGSRTRNRRQRGTPATLEWVLIIRHPPPPRGGGRGPAPPPAPAQPRPRGAARPARAPRAARLRPRAPPPRWPSTPARAWPCAPPPGSTGCEVLAGYAATSRDGDPEPDVLLVADEAVAPGVGALLRAALAEQSRRGASRRLVGHGGRRRPLRPSRRSSPVTGGRLGAVPGHRAPRRGRRRREAGPSSGCGRRCAWPTARATWRAPRRP